MQLIIRSIFTVAILIGVYTETGPFTTVSFFLVFVGLEMISHILEDEEP